ncbi:tetratricopeptide repeat protein [Janthinobacterium sp.]|uniref:tetratricopeptide repeat protein n=1 Tax=Janthinobacterium sp. TaxID=1871054 RepID=UPI00293D7E3A|nr:tetratricopeptide repeat protein [Janthinobacterium sp.]
MSAGRRAAAGVWLALACAPAAGGNYCGELDNAFGPYDYRSHQGGDLQVVEKHHFTEQVAAGVRGETGYLGGDLDYTLRAFPNHVPALLTMSRLGLQGKSATVRGAPFPVECYFERALRFAPDDAAVLSAYANFALKQGRPEQALPLFQRAAALEPENAAVNYNMGLAYLKRRDYAQANVYAQKAYALGFPLPGLRNLLRAAGQWREAPAAPPPAESAAADSGGG